MTNTVTRRGGSRSDMQQKHIEFELAASGHFDDVAEIELKRVNFFSTVSPVAFFPSPVSSDAILGNIFDAACEQARRQEEATLARELHIHEHPRWAELQGVPGLLLKEGVYMPAGSTTDREASEASGPHRRTGKGPQSGSKFEESRKTREDRGDIMERDAKVARAHIISHDHN